jgi:hypothetical protein
VSDPFCRLYSTETYRNIVVKPYASGRRQDYIDLGESAKLPPVIEERSWTGLWGLDKREHCARDEKGGLRGRPGRIA